MSNCPKGKRTNPRSLIPGKIKIEDLYFAGKRAITDLSNCPKGKRTNPRFFPSIRLFSDIFPDSFRSRRKSVLFFSEKGPSSAVENASDFRRQTAGPPKIHRIFGGHPGKKDPRLPSKIAGAPDRRSGAQGADFDGKRRKERSIFLFQKSDGRAKNFDDRGPQKNQRNIVSKIGEDDGKFYFTNEKTKIYNISITFSSRFSHAKNKTPQTPLFGRGPIFKDTAPSIHSLLSPENSMRGHAFFSPTHLCSCLPRKSHAIGPHRKSHAIGPHRVGKKLPPGAPIFDRASLQRWWLGGFLGDQKRPNQILYENNNINKCGPGMPSENGGFILQKPLIKEIGNYTKQLKSRETALKTLIIKTDSLLKPPGGHHL